MWVPYCSPTAPPLLASSTVRRDRRRRCSHTSWVQSTSSHAFPSEWRACGGIESPRVWARRRTHRPEGFVWRYSSRHPKPAVAVDYQSSASGSDWVRDRSALRRYLNHIIWRFVSTLSYSSPSTVRHKNKRLYKFWQKIHANEVNARLYLRVSREGPSGEGLPSERNRRVRICFSSSWLSTR